jgi:hypothetical protein
MTELANIAIMNMQRIFMDVFFTNKKALKQDYCAMHFLSAAKLRIKQWKSKKYLLNFNKYFLGVEIHASMLMS